MTANQRRPMILPLLALTITGSFFSPVLAQDPVPVPKPEATPPAPPDGPLFKMMTLAEAMKEARAKKQLVVIFWTQTGNTDTNRMLATTWRDPAVHTRVTELGIAVAVDGYEKPKLAGTYGVNDYPTTMIVEPGNPPTIYDNEPGYLSPASFLKFCNAATAGHLGAPATKPTGENANDVMAWMAWGNSLYGDSEEKNAAAEAYGWLLQHGEEFQPGFDEAYVDFVLKRILKIGSRHKPAKERVDSLRDKIRDDIMFGNAEDHAVWLLSRYNYWTRNNDGCLLAWEGMRTDTEKQQHLKDLLFEYAMPLLVAHRRYSDVRAACDNKMYERIEALILAHMDRVAKTDPNADFEVQGILREERVTLLVLLADYYETLLGVGLGADAEKLLVLLGDFNPTGRSYALMIQRAARLKHESIINHIADVGIEKLEGRGKKRIRNAQKQAIATMHTRVMRKVNDTAEALRQLDDERNGKKEDRETGSGDGGGDGGF